MTKSSGNTTVTPNADAWIMVCLRCWADYNLLIYTHCQKLMNSVGSHGSLSVLFMMRVMVWCFVSNTHKVMTAFIVMSPSRCCSWVFSTVLYIASVSTRLARYWPSYSYILAEAIVCSWDVIDDLREKLWMQATVAYYLMLDNHHRMSSGYLRAEFDERKVSRKWPCEIKRVVTFTV
jgi:hypothetical protein